MFKNLTKEIISYSVIPVAVIAVIILLLLLLGKKKNDNYYKYNYSIKVLLSILICFMLSIMVGYTIWVYKRIISLEIVSQNTLYMIVLAIVDISLFISLIMVTYKLYKSLNSNNEQEKELQD